MTPMVGEATHLADGHIVLDGKLLGASLVAEQRNCLGRRPHKSYSSRNTCRGEGRHFGQKTVAGMDGVSAYTESHLTHSGKMEGEKRHETAILSARLFSTSACTYGSLRTHNCRYLDNIANI
jgi:hypothetical protein